MNRFTIAPVSFFLPAVAFEFERAIDSDGSLYVGPQVSLVGLRQPGAYGIDLHLGLRLFPGSQAPGGFWIGPETRVSYGFIPSISSVPIWAFALMGTIGYSVVTGGGFTVSFGVALGGGVSTVPGSPILAAGGHLNIGYAF